MSTGWQRLKRFTGARVALGRAGDSLRTQQLLEFELAHARARDAVLLNFDVPAVRDGVLALGLEAVLVHSAAGNRQQYLRRPDLGRRLDKTSRAKLERLRSPVLPDLVFVIGDGLSPAAAQNHAIPVIALLKQQLTDWNVAPVVIAEQARVALSDEIGSVLGAEIAVMLIGERPGLSSPDSLGAYLTYRPQVGRTDAERNCVSNIRPQGLAYDGAAFRLGYLLRAARQRQISGVNLKDESDAAEVLAAASAAPVLLPEEQ